MKETDTLFKKFEFLVTINNPIEVYDLKLTLWEVYEKIKDTHPDITVKELVQKLEEFDELYDPKKEYNFD